MYILKIFDTVLLKWYGITSDDKVCLEELKEWYEKSEFECSIDLK